MPLIGLTGGYASGKSLVAGMLEKLGAVIIDADILAREVVEPGSEGLTQVVERFGAGVLKEDGSLDRKRLGEIVFGDRAALAELEGIIHPRVRKLLFQRAEEALGRDKSAVVVAVVPLLFEKGLDGKMEKTVTVTCGLEQQVERAVKRDGITADEARKRVALQSPLDDKAARSDYVVDNRSDVAQTQAQVSRLWSVIKR